MSNLKLELTEQPTAEEFRVILDGVRTFNRAQTGNEQPRPVACYLRDANGRIRGGVQANLWGRSAHIDALWVDDEYRGAGHGSELMRAIEEYAVTHRCPLIYLETTSFQALPFYQGLSYHLFGQLDGISEGHTLYFLKKDLG
jgi:GNAT superfamily N-acetyltransferase